MGRVSYLTTQYNYSLTQFAQIQQNYTSGTINSITSYIDPSNRSNISYLLQYLRIDKFRSFNIAGLNQQLLNKGVHNQAQHSITQLNIMILILFSLFHSRFMKQIGEQVV